MIKIVNTEYRNIQEQVAKNASDIADLDSKIDETKEEITGGSPYTIDMLYQQNVGQDNSIALLQSGKQDKLTAGDGIDITDNVISATSSGGGGAYKHTLSGTSASMDVLSYLIDADPTPITNTNFIDRVRFAFAMQSSSRQPFTNYCSQTEQYKCIMTWQSGSNAFSANTITFQNVVDVVSEL